MDKRDLLLASLLATASFSVFGHGDKGLEQYDTSELLEISGTVVGYEARDPQSLLFVDVVENGKTTRWTVVGGRSAGIARAGLSHAYLTGRPKVTVQLYEARDNTCSPRCVGLG